MVLSPDYRARTVREELQRAIVGNAFGATEAGFDGLDQHLAHRLARQDTTKPSSPSHDLAVAAALGPTPLAVVRLQFGSVRPTR